MGRFRRMALFSALVIVALLLGSCAIKGSPSGKSKWTPTPTKTLEPTFTPLPTQQATQAASATSGGQKVNVTVTSASQTPTKAKATPTKASTPTPTKPQLKITAEGKVNIRSGPGTNYRVIGQVSNGQTFDIVGKDSSGKWYQFCCFNGKKGWIYAKLVSVSGTLEQVAVVKAPPPPPTATPRPKPPTPTPKPTTPPKIFKLLFTEKVFNTNPVLTVWAAVFSGQETPVGGYKVVLLKNGVKVGEAVSKPFFENTSPSPDIHPHRPANIKIEIKNPGAATWEFFVVDGAGNPISDKAVFQTTNGPDNRIVFGAFHKER